MFNYVSCKTLYMYVKYSKYVHAFIIYGYKINNVGTLNLKNK